MIAWFTSIYLGLASLFIFGSVLFWLALFGFSVGIIYFDEDDSPVLASITVGLTLFTSQC